jgi:hypothetical protein
VEWWRSVEEVLRKGDFIMGTHDPILLEKEIYP